MRNKIETMASIMTHDFTLLFCIARLIIMAYQNKLASDMLHMHK